MLLQIHRREDEAAETKRLRSLLPYNNRAENGKHAMKKKTFFFVVVIKMHEEFKSLLAHIAVKFKWGLKLYLMS